MEFFYMSIVTTIGGIIIALLLDRSKDKRYDYELKRFRYSKKAQKELKAMEIKPRHVPDIKETAINKLLQKVGDMYQGDDIEDTPEAGLEDMIVDFAKNNPEIVQRFLGGSKSGSDEDQTLTMR